MYKEFYGKRNLLELHWRSNPAGKVRANLPFYKHFTQIS